jgi:RNA polymerase primary sigma factor
MATATSDDGGLATVFSENLVLNPVLELNYSASCSDTAVSRSDDECAEFLAAIRESLGFPKLHESRDRLLLRYQPLVRKVVRRLVRNAALWDDLESEGVIELFHAIGRFDPASGALFSSYAAICIRGRVLDVLSAQEGLGISGNASRRLQRLRQAMFEIGSDASAEDLDRVSGLGLLRIKRLRPVAVRVSLDAPSSDESDVPLGECAMPDPAFTEKPKDAADHVQTSEDLAILGTALQQLQCRERFILEYLFGIGGRTLQSQAELANLMGITRQRVSQIATVALKRLRAQGWGSV